IAKDQPAIFSWKPYQRRRPHLSELDVLFENANGIACVNGFVSGNKETLDFEDEDSYQQFEDILLERGEDSLARKVLNAPLVRTPRPGRHLHYRCEGSVEGTLKLAFKNFSEKERKQGAKTPSLLIETRGESHYALLPGSLASCHPSER